MLPSEYKAEAERLAMLPPSDQQEILALHQSIAENPRLPAEERRLAQERADGINQELSRLRKKSRKVP